MGTVTRHRSAGRLGGRAATLVLFATIWLGSGLGAVGPVAAAGSTFGAPTATSTFGASVVFNQPVNLATVPDRVEILILAPGAIGPTVSQVAVPGAGTRTLRFVLSLATAHLFPNTTLSASWRLVFGTQAVVGPSVSVTYADTRFAWRTQTGLIVRIHWYQGDAAFGARALAIAERGVQTAEQLLGVKETAPIDFFVYAAQSPFYDALGPGTRENVGGEAVAEIRTLFALITPDEVNASWVSTVLPHELTHLVFNTAVANPYHFPPRWLNEGLAVYLSQGYDTTDRGLIASAVAAGNLTPLDGLAGQFPSTQGQFYLAYAESVSAVDYLIRTYGRRARLPRQVLRVRCHRRRGVHGHPWRRHGDVRPGLARLPRRCGAGEGRPSAGSTWSGAAGMVRWRGRRHGRRGWTVESGTGLSLADGRPRWIRHAGLLHADRLLAARCRAGDRGGWRDPRDRRLARSERSDVTRGGE